MPRQPSPDTCMTPSLPSTRVPSKRPTMARRARFPRRTPPSRRATTERRPSAPTTRRARSSRAEPSPRRTRTPRARPSSAVRRSKARAAGRKWTPARRAASRSSASSSLRGTAKARRGTPVRGAANLPSNHRPDGAWILQPRSEWAPASRRDRTTPISRRKGVAPGLSASPHGLERGNAVASISRTRAPADARRQASELPAGPAPTMRASECWLAAGGAITPRTRDPRSTA